MEKVQKKDNNRISSNNVTNSEGKVSQLVSNTPLMLKKSNQNQMAFSGANVVQKKENSTGLPDNLKTGIESLSGYSMDDVNVHYNSSKPAQLNAHAFAQGSDIHVASGQEKHLPHEAWHVVQQKQGRVQSTRQMKGKMNINDDVGLEDEADVMGEKALQMNSIKNKSLVTKKPMDSLQLRATEEDEIWATKTKKNIWYIHNMIVNARTRLNKDARVASDYISKAQTIYKGFKTKYNDAVDSFVGGVESAQANEKKIRDDMKFVATLAMGLHAKTAFAVYSAVDGVLSKVSGIASVLNGAKKPSKGSVGGLSPAMSARTNNYVDWNDLLTTTLEAFNKTLQQNEILNSMIDNCTNKIQFLDDVENGSYKGDDPKKDLLAIQSMSLVNNMNSLKSQLNKIQEGTISGPCKKFAYQVSNKLSTLTKHKLEQDLAIRWMAGLPYKKQDEIDTASKYLTRIGLFDVKNSRLGVHTGRIIEKRDEEKIHWRAQWESLAMKLVGSRVSWLGGFKPLISAKNGKYKSPPKHSLNLEPDKCFGLQIYRGRVRDNHNREWFVDVPDGNATIEGGGFMRLESYVIDHGSSLSKQDLRFEIRFSAKAEGKLGGGVLPSHSIIY